MNNRGILTSDLHLTANIDDGYRWNIFPFLKKKAKEYEALKIFILGDLTDKKDNHPSKLVNKLVDSLMDLATHAELFILKGNHDYVDPNMPYMKFLNHTAGVNFIAEPTIFENISLLPHTRYPNRDWSKEFFKSEYVFMHQTVKGSMASNGFKLQEGVPSHYFKKMKCKIYSGDIHVPQRIGRVEYVGTPYPIRYGDDHKHRILALDFDTHEVEEFYMPTIKKTHLKIADPDNLKLSKYKNKDQLKITLLINKKKAHNLNTMIDAVKDKFINSNLRVPEINVEVNRRTKPILYEVNKDKISEELTDEEVLERFGHNENLGDDYLDFGRDLL